MARFEGVEGTRLLDLVGIGFGPANLALALALREEPGAAALDVRFLERQATFGWHRGMLLDDTTMQVSFLKDLVTLRNPASRFTFLAYLHEIDRLADFINHKTLFPLRQEFHGYFEWAAAQVEDLVGYSRPVVELRPVRADTDAPVEALQVVVGGDQPEVLTARNVVLGTGLVPRLPKGVALSARVWHNYDLLPRLAALSAAPERVVVVGAGQSAAEVAAYLHGRYPDVEVCAVFRRFGYSPADDSPFVNRIFDPESVDGFFAAPEDVKRLLVEYHGNTNYSAVDLDLIQDLYRTAYRERVAGRERLRFHHVSQIVDLTEDDAGVDVVVESLMAGSTFAVRADVVIYCTGYDADDPWALLGELGSYCRRDQDGRVCVNRDYRVVTDPALRAGVYLQGATEHSHGLSSSLLSNGAVRAGDILDSILGRTAAAQLTEEGAA